MRYLSRTVAMTTAALLFLGTPILAFAAPGESGTTAPTAGASTEPTTAASSLPVPNDPSSPDATAPSAEPAPSPVPEPPDAPTPPVDPTSEATSIAVPGSSPSATAPSPAAALRKKPVPNAVIVPKAAASITAAPGTALLEPAKQSSDVDGDLIAIIPEAPGFVQATCADRWMEIRIPKAGAGIEYYTATGLADGRSIDYTEGATLYGKAGRSVTVTASPEPGYTAEITTWEFTYIEPTDCPTQGIVVAPTEPRQETASGCAVESYLEIPTVQGVDYLADGQKVTGKVYFDYSITIEAIARNGYILDPEVPHSWTSTPVAIPSMLPGCGAPITPEAPTASPTEPTCTTTKMVVSVPANTWFGVSYVNKGTGREITDPITLAPNESVTIEAVLADYAVAAGSIFMPSATTEWTFAFTPPKDCSTGAPVDDGPCVPVDPTDPPTSAPVPTPATTPATLPVTGPNGIGLLIATALLFGATGIALVHRRRIRG